MAIFYKDTTEVARIGSDGGQGFIHGAGTDTGIFFGSNNLYPYRSTGLDNATIDIGQTGKRFRDIYLSGGIQFDVNGEFLDDYEEGTWTPSLGGTTGGNFTMSTQQGFYTKVGSVVTVYYNVQYSSTASASGVVRFNGFPFTAKNNTGAYYYTGSTINTNGQIAVALAGNGTQAIFHTSTSGAGTVSEFNASGDDRVNGSFSYLTDA